MSDYEYESDYNEMENVPYIQMELDIRDVHQIYKALQCHEEHGKFGCLLYTSDAADEL